MLILLLLSCADFDPVAWIEEANASVDHDGDGISPAQGDCDDGCVEMVYTEQGEVCTGWFIHPGALDTDPRPFGPDVDYDCDGVVDGAEPGADFDEDGYSPVPVDDEDLGDCDDLNSRVHFGHPECCDDGFDNNCDGRWDEVSCEFDTLACPVTVSEME